MGFSRFASFFTQLLSQNGTGEQKNEDIHSKINKDDYKNEEVVITDGNFSLQLWGAPSNLSQERRVEILNAVIEHNKHKLRNGPFSAGQIIDTQQLKLNFGDVVHTVRYQLRAMHFLQAMQVFGEAVNYVTHQKEMGVWDAEVANITEQHLRTAAKEVLRKAVSSSPPSYRGESEESDSSISSGSTPDNIAPTSGMSEENADEQSI